METMGSKFPFLCVEGTNYDMGHQIGRNLKDLIQRFIYFIIGDLPLEKAKNRAAAFIPAFEAHCPHLLEEIQGISDGAEISLEEAMLPNIRGGIHRVQGCTAFVISKKATDSGIDLIGQNQDLPWEMENFGVVMQLSPKGGSRILMWTFAGLVGYHGMNDDGLAFFCNSVPEPPFSDPTTSEKLMPGYMVKRLMLEQPSIQGVLTVFERLKCLISPFGQANYVLRDRQGIADVELHNDGYEFLGGDAESFIAHTNHYVSERLVHLNQYTLPTLIRAGHEADSIPRLKRMNELLDRMDEKISIEGLKRALSDHENYPRSICRHRTEQETSMTVASIIAEPELKRMHLCPGNPCSGRYHTYAM